MATLMMFHWPLKQELTYINIIYITYDILDYKINKVHSCNKAFKWAIDISFSWKLPNKSYKIIKGNNICKIKIYKKLI